MGSLATDPPLPIFEHVDAAAAVVQAAGQLGQFALSADQSRPGLGRADPYTPVAFQDLAGGRDKAPIPPQRLPQFEGAGEGIDHQRAPKGGLDRTGDGLVAADPVGGAGDDALAIRHRRRIRRRRQLIQADDLHASGIADQFRQVAGGGQHVAQPVAHQPLLRPGQGGLYHRGPGHVRLDHLAEHAADERPILIHTAAQAALPGSRQHPANTLADAFQAGKHFFHRPLPRLPGGVLLTYAGDGLGDLLIQPAQAFQPSAGGVELGLAVTQHGAGVIQLVLDRGPASQEILERPGDFLGPAGQPLPLDVQVFPSQAVRVDLVMQLRGPSQQIDGAVLLVLQFLSQRLQRLACGVVLVGKLLLLLLEVPQPVGQGRLLLLLPGVFGGVGLGPGGDLVVAGGVGDDVVAQLGGAGVQHLRPLPGSQRLGRNLRQPPVQTVGLLLQVGYLGLGGGARRLQPGDPGGSSGQGVVELIGAALELLPPAAEAVVLSHREQAAQLVQLGAVLTVAAGLARLVLDAAEALADLGVDVGQPQQILLHALQPE